MKTFISLVVLCFPLIALAQLEKGKSVLSGNISYSARGGESETKSSSTSIYASYGYLIADRWAIGLTPSFDASSNAQNNDSYHYSSFSIGPFVRRYFAVGEKLFFHLDASAAAGFEKSHSKYADGSTSDVKGKSMNVTLRTGFSYFINEKFALQAALGGVTFTRDSHDPDNFKNWNFAANFNLRSFSLGAAWYF